MTAAGTVTAIALGDHRLRVIAAGDIVRGLRLRLRLLAGVPGRRVTVAGAGKPDAGQLGGVSHAPYTAFAAGAAA